MTPRRRLGRLCGLAFLVGFGVGLWQWFRPPLPRAILQARTAGLSVCFSPDGKTLATWCGGGDRLLLHYKLTLWDVETGQKRHEFFQGRCALAATFSPDGRKVASRSFDCIQVWDVVSGEQLATFDNPSWRQPQLVYSKEGRLLALTEQYELWDVAENKVIKKLALDGEKEITQGDASILVLGKGQNVKIWDLVTARICAEQVEIPNTEQERRFFPEVTLTGDRRFLFYCPNNFGSRSPCGFVVDLVDKRKMDFGQPVAISPDGQTIAQGNSGGRKKSAPNWLADWLGIAGKPSQYWLTIKSFPSGEHDIVLHDCFLPFFSPDGKTLATTAPEPDCVQLWDLPIGRPVGRILGFAVLAAFGTLLALSAIFWFLPRVAR